MPAHSFQAPTLIGCQIFKERIFGLSSCVLPANCCSYFAESLRILTSYYLLRILYRVQHYNIFFGYLLASTYLLDPKILLCANAANSLSDPVLFAFASCFWSRAKDYDGFICLCQTALPQTAKLSAKQPGFTNLWCFS